MVDGITRWYKGSIRLEIMSAKALHLADSRLSRALHGMTCHPTPEGRIELVRQLKHALQ